MKTFKAFMGIELNCSRKRSKRRRGIRSRKRKATQELPSQEERSGRRAISRWGGEEMEVRWEGGQN